MKRKPTEAQKAAADEKRQKVRAMAQRISQMTPDEQAALTHGMIATIEGHTLSGTNQILVAMQGCRDNIVAGFRQWKSKGRTVRKGEHGFSIWVPIGLRDDDQDDNGSGKSDLHFMLGTVFGISQTDPIETGIPTNETISQAAFDACEKCGDL